MFCICNTGLTVFEVKRLKIGQKLLLHTREGYCSLLAEVYVSGNIGAVGCNVAIEKILDPHTENKTVPGNVIWANFNDLTIIN